MFELLRTENEEVLAKINKRAYYCNTNKEIDIVSTSQM